MMVLIPAAALLPFAARLRRRWDEDRYREEMLFEEELRRRQQQEKKTTYEHIPTTPYAAGEGPAGIPRHHRSRGAGRAVFPALM
jgi:hypothetical protein